MPRIDCATSSSCRRLDGGRDVSGSASASAHRDHPGLRCRRGWTLRDDLHHLSYDRLGNERHEDLLPLCRTCHRALHRILDTSPHWRAMPRSTASLAIIERLGVHAQPNHSL